jgi:branched-chain amino acid transport system permease protein
VLSLQTHLQGYAQWMPVIQGAVFVLVVTLLPRGIVGEFAGRLARWSRADAPEPAMPAHADGISDARSNSAT